MQIDRRQFAGYLGSMAALGSLSRGVGANVLPVVDFGDANGPAIDKLALGLLHRLLQDGVVELAARRLLEIHALYLHGLFAWWKNPDTDCTDKSK